jgi:hypothetical protein
MTPVPQPAHSRPFLYIFSWDFRRVGHWRSALLTVCTNFQTSSQPTFTVIFQPGFKNVQTVLLSITELGPCHLCLFHGLINFVDTKAKCRHLKKLICKGTLRQAFIRVYRLDMQSVMLVFFRPSFVSCCPSNLLSG